VKSSLDKTLPHDTARVISRAVRGTFLGLIFERMCHAFWPLFTAACTVSAFVLFGALSRFEGATWGLLVGVLAVFGALGLRAYTQPTWAQARAAVDARLPDQPLQALSDTPVLTSGAGAEHELWVAHYVRMAQSARAATAIAPSINLRARDPYALRLIALTALAMGLLFGSFGGTENRTLPQGAVAQGPSWEGWVTPPAYTGKPVLYLADLSESFAASKGSDVLVRVYGALGDVTMKETVSGPSGSENAVEESTARAEGGLPQAYEFTIQTAGEIEVSGASGRVWSVALSRDSAPTVQFNGPLTRAAAGDLRQAYTLEDDIGLERAVLTVTRDLEAVTPQFGYAVEAEPRPALELELLLPTLGATSNIAAVLEENFAHHPFASLPVTLTLQAWDGAGQSSNLALNKGILPGRQFFDPLAAALIDVRAELLWSRANAARSERILRAIGHAPEDLFESDQTALLRLGVLVERIEQNGSTMSDVTLKRVTEALWILAVELEEGDLAEALERLRRAQRQLAEAMKDGASAEDIARLMQELREATQAYLEQLAEQQGGSEQSQSGGGGSDSPQEVTQDQIQELMDRIQELMEQGRMTEAQQLMEFLNELLANLQVQQNSGQAGGSAGQGGAGAGGEGGQGLEGALREQQDLNDDTFEQLQKKFENGQSDAQGGQGDGEGSGDAQGGPQDLEERQKSVREGVGRSGGSSDALGEADRAMKNAEEALGAGDYAQALEEQARAMEALREELRASSEQDEAGGANTQQGGEGGSGGTDPLGRGNMLGGEAGSLEGNETQQGRAQALADEVRRRAAEQDRDLTERDFLKRLLKEF
jgi:uncharacterized protein (TIGR02302 family)